MIAFPSLRQILLVYVFALFATLVASVALHEMVAEVSPRLALLIAEISFFAVVAGYMRVNAMNPTDIWLLNAVSRRTLLLSALVAASASVLVAEIHGAFTELMYTLGAELPLYQQRLMLEIQVVRTLGEFGQAAAVVVVVPGLLEELAFRGFVFGGLCFYRGPQVALFASSLLFAAFHLDPWHFPAVFLLGFTFATLVWLTHSIYPAILAHMINNLVSLVELNLQTHLGIELLAREAPAILGIPAMILLVAGLLLLRRQPSLVPLPSPVAYSQTRAAIG
jgi:membrane protease YdiL (CAAX protease family)